MQAVSSRKFIHSLLAMGVAAIAAIACGDGGGGPSNGPTPCGGPCSQGTSCNEASGRCECTAAPADSCAPFGKRCNSQKICVELKPSDPAVEGASCSGAETEIVDGLACADPFGKGDRRWARVCTAGGHCDGLTTACIKDPSAGAELSVCWENPCGDDAVQTGEGGEPVFRNGENWGPCDVNDGDMSSDSSDPSGSCLPGLRNGKTVFLCTTSGTLPEESACKADHAERGDPGSQCQQGQSCFPTFSFRGGCEFTGNRDTCPESQICNVGDCVPGPGTVCYGQCENKKCEDDQECGEGAYCGGGTCRLFGRCMETCNGGIAGGEAGAFASCGDEGSAICSGGLPANALELEHALGYCQAGCDIFEEEPSCPIVDGIQQICVPSATGGAPLAGSCATGRSFPRDEGDACESTDDPCGPGLTCRMIVDDEGHDVYRCLRLCACEGEGGWDQYGRCQTQAPRCDEGQECVMIQHGNPHLGVCLNSSQGEEE